MLQKHNPVCTSFYAKITHKFDILIVKVYKTHYYVLFNKGDSSNKYEYCICESVYLLFLTISNTKAEHKSHLFLKVISFMHSFYSVVIKWDPIFYIIFP